MTFIFDKILILILSFLVLIQAYAGISTVVVLLVSLFAATLCSLAENKYMTLIWSIGLAIGAIFVPQLTFMLPVIAYDAFGLGLYTSIGLYLVDIIYNTQKINASLLVYIAVLIVVSCLLYYKSSKMQKLSLQIRQVRDDEEERNIVLETKNRHLIEKQDQEVYVATLKERNRIAREIHDNVGHILTRTILQMGALMTIHKKDEQLHEQLNLVKENLDVAMNNVRESVHDLHDESVDMKQALTEITDGLKDRFESRFIYDVSEQVDKRYKYAMIGIVKEGVSNILKHSTNSHADVILREHPSMYQIVIHDYDEQSNSNVAEDKQYVKSDGIGLQNINDRVHGLGGHVTISREQGFKVFVTIPKEVA